MSRKWKRIPSKKELRAEEHHFFAISREDAAAERRAAEEDAAEQHRLAMLPQKEREELGIETTVEILSAELLKAEILKEEADDHPAE